jgi:GAF domain-containing protein
VPTSPLEQITRDVAALTGATLVAVWAADERARTLTVAAASGDGAAVYSLATLPYGIGGVGWVAGERTPLEVADVAGDARFPAAQWRRSHGLPSFLGMPLLASDRLLGVLALDGRAPFALTVEQREGVARLAARTVGLLDQARRDDERRREDDELAASRAELAARVREMGALVSVSAILGTTSDLTESLRLICRELGQLTGADTVAAYLIDHERGEVSPVAGYHIPPAVREALAGARLPLAEARFSGDLLDGRNVVWSDDAPSDARFVNGFFARFPHRSCAFVPLRTGGHALGVLHLVWWTAARKFTAGEIALLEAIGRQASILLENARLLQAEIRAQELRAVARLANAAAHEINNPLAIIVAHLQVLARRADDAEHHRFERILTAAARIQEIVQHMTQITRLEDADVRPSLPPMLDLRRSSEPESPAT